MSRMEGWEARLGDTIERARSRSYKIGEHDCFRVACEVVEALTGVDRWSEWQGRYSTEREALRLLAAHGHSFESAGDKFFGVARCAPRLAQRGDIVAFRAANGTKHLGVCMGEKTAVTSAEGLAFVGTLEALCAWRIG